MVSSLTEAEVSDECLAAAEESEVAFKWQEASAYYTRALSRLTGSSLENLLRARLGYSLFQAAMQTQSPSEFGPGIRSAIEVCKKGRFDNTSTSPDGPSAFRCQAMVAYLESWLDANPKKRKQHLDSAWALTKQSLEACQKALQFENFVETYTRLGITAQKAFSLDWSISERRKMMREAISLGEEAIRYSRLNSSQSQLALSLVQVATHLLRLERVLGPEDKAEKKTCRGRAVKYWREARDLSEEIAHIESLRFDSPAGMEFEEGKDPSKSFTETAESQELTLKFARARGDNFLIASALDWLAQPTLFTTFETEDGAEAIRQCDKALSYAEEAQRCYAAMSFLSARGGLLWTGAPRAEYYTSMYLVEIDQEKRKDLLRRALDELPALLRLSEQSGYPEVLSDAHHVISKTFLYFSRM
ncbi:hypothetical protein E6H34_00825, partial [Candidatus Bathyarchaeota archaeon]